MMMHWMMHGQQQVPLDQVMEESGDKHRPLAGFISFLAARTKPLISTCSLQCYCTSFEVAVDGYSYG